MVFTRKIRIKQPYLDFEEGKDYIVFDYLAKFLVGAKIAKYVISRSPKAGT